MRISDWSSDVCSSDLTPVSLLEMGRAFLGSRWQVVWKIVLPSAAPVIFAGLRLGCASGFIGVILAELLITPTGIGDIITYNQSIAEDRKSTRLNSSH